jgi:hypothetical protein
LEEEENKKAKRNLISKIKMNLVSKQEKSRFEMVDGCKISIISSINRSSDSNLKKKINESTRILKESLIDEMNKKIDIEIDDFKRLLIKKISQISNEEIDKYIININECNSKDLKVYDSSYDFMLRER